ncbi:uncharacterized protein GGS25DRAFT_497140 [Hypoxylon fragiforme]|uniref:uncharacterized protein n=1 Tax=Hypoxylon fragiforme TaxID=63214 RepID=UPI0020C5D66C|nr:uncharacterized protein GGS25DRAFT_497140 [Hypoxylon fragiforme]KAI2607706.1 hypothetical protein GGS25DRAFT_497140 [Hypoxylon fragiforme]
MAIPWLLSLVFLLAPLAVAQGYSDGNDLLDVTITKSVTETVTKYLSQCGISPTPFEASETTILSGTTTVTSTLESTISVVITPNVTDVSGVLPTGFTTSEFALNSTHPGLSRSLTHSHPSGFNYSTPLANVTTTLPCSTATGNLKTEPLITCERMMNLICNLRWL